MCLETVWRALRAPGPGTQYSPASPGAGSPGVRRQLGLVGPSLSPPIPPRGSFVPSDHKPQGLTTNQLPTISTGVTLEAWRGGIQWGTARQACCQGLGGKDEGKRWREMAESFQGGWPLSPRRWRVAAARPCQACGQRQKRWSGHPGTERRHPCWRCSGRPRQTWPCPPGASRSGWPPSFPGPPDPSRGHTSPPVATACPRHVGASWLTFSLFFLFQMKM